MKTKNLHVNTFFAAAMVLCLSFLMASCSESSTFEATTSTGTMEGVFEVDQQMTADNVFVVNFIGSGTVTVNAGARFGVSVPAMQMNLSGSTLRVPLSGAPTMIGEHTFFLEVIADGVTHTIPATFNVTQDGIGAEPVKLTFINDHPTQFALGNARMIPFEIYPTTATVSLRDLPPGVMGSVNVHDRINGRGFLTLTPRAGFTGGSFEVRATNFGNLSTTQVFSVSSVPRVEGGRRGVAMSTGVDRGTIWENLYQLQPHWWWSWGVNLTEAQLALMPENLEWVPTFWGAGSVNPTNIARVNELHERGIVRYVRGFNEPDLEDQANMTVDNALSLWRTLSEQLHPDIRLISPAESHPRLGANNWLPQFMRGVEEQGLRVDYVAIHIYPGGPWPAQIVNPIRDVYRMWGRRVWLMETNIRHPNVHGIHSNNRHTPRMIKAYMQELLPVLETMPELHRYSWFEPGNGMAGLWPGRLIGCNHNIDGYNPAHPPQSCTNAQGCDQLTIVGEFYRTVNPNVNIRRRH